MVGKAQRDGGQALIRGASGAIWLLLAGGLPLVFMPDAMSPFAPVKRDFFYALAMVQFGLAALSNMNDPRAFARRAALSPIVLPAALAALGTIAGLAFLRREGTGVSSLLDTAFGAGLCVTYLAEGSRRLDNKMIAAFTVSCLASAAYGAAQYLGLDFLTWKTAFAGDAPGSTFGNPLFLADGLLAALAFLLVFLVFGEKRWRPAAFIAAALVWLVLLLTQARGAWLGAVFGAAPLAVFYALRRGPRGSAKRLALFGAAALLAAALLSVPGLNPGKGVPVISHAATVLSPLGGAFKGRFLLWESTAMMVREKPVLGWGAGNLKLHYQEFQGKLLALPRYEGLSYHTTSHSHNDYLQVLAERGVLGLGLFVWLLACFGAMVFRPGVRPAQAAAAAAIAGWLVDSLFNGPLTLPPSSLLFWVFLAVACRHDAGGPRSEERVPGTAALLLLYVFVLFTARPFVRDLASEAYLQAGEFARERGDTRNSLILYLKSSGLALEDRRHHFYLGQAYYAAGMWAESEEEFALDVSENPTVATGWYNLGAVRMSRGRFKQALEAFVRASAIDPNNPETKKMVEEAKRKAEGAQGRARGPGGMVN